MREWGEGGVAPGLKAFVAEASWALARLDADRLEEMALSCQLLNRDGAPGAADKRAELGRQAAQAGGEMAVFARVLEATRANLNVINRLKELRQGRAGYGDSPAGFRKAPRWVGTEGGHGND